MKTRVEIDKKYKIDLKDLFKNDEEFLKEVDHLNKKIEEFEKFQGHLLDDDKTLLEFLKLDDEISAKLEVCYVYAHLNNDFDLGEKRSNEFFGKAVKLYNKYSTNISYVIPELLQNDYKIIEKFINENKDLKQYERMLKNIFKEKSHFLSKEEERVLSVINDSFRTPENAYSKLLDADLTFESIKDENGKKVELTSSNWAKYLESKNRNVRKNAFKKFYKSYINIRNTTTELLASEVKNNNNIAKLRKYDSALSASLESNDVNPQIYNSLINHIHNNLKKTYKYWDLRKKILGVSNLHIYDTYVPMVDANEKEYSFEEAKELVLNALSILGDDYTKVLNEAFDNNWIDVFPTKNKRSGGYCTAVYNSHPYVFLNFDNRYGEVSTVAHELGHAMHSYYSIKNNNYVDYSYSIFVAEVASQVNEIILSDYMIKNSKDKQEKLFVLDELLKRFKASVIRQAMFAEFEKEIHEKEQNGVVLTSEYLNDLYYKLNKLYFGPSVEIDKEIAFEWERIPHFFYNFYVYQYSTGYIAALKIAKDIINKKENALENYLKFLSLGCTMDPVSELKVAGVDLTKDEVYNEAFEEFEKEIEEFEKIYKGSE